MRALVGIAGAAHLVFDARHREAEILARARPSARNRFPARRPAPRPKTGIVGQRRQGRTPATRLRAFSRAFSAKVAPVSSGSGRPRSAAPIDVEPEGVRAAPRFRAPCPDCGWRRRACLPERAGSQLQAPPSVPAPIAMPLRARPSSCDSSSSLNGAPSAVPWISTSPPDAGEHEIGVGVGGGILGIIQIEHRLALIDSAGDGRDMILDRMARDQPGRGHEASGSDAAPQSRR